MASNDFLALQHLSSSIIQICEDIQKLLSSLNKHEETAPFSQDIAALATAVDSAKTCPTNDSVSASEVFILVHDCEFPLRQAEFTLRTTRDIKAVATYAEVLKGRTVPLISLSRRRSLSYCPEPLGAPPRRLPPIPAAAPLTITPSTSGSSPPGYTGSKASENAAPLSITPSPSGSPPLRRTGRKISENAVLEAGPAAAPLTITTPSASGSPLLRQAGRKMSEHVGDKAFRNHAMVTKWVSHLNMYELPPAAADGTISPSRRGTAASAMTTSATMGDRLSKIYTEADVDAIYLRQCQLQALRAFEEGKLDIAKDIAKSALELAGKLDAKLTLNSSEMWKLEQLLVESCLKQGKWDEVEEILRRMQEDDSMEEDAKLWILHWMAEMYLGKGKLDDAESYGWQAWRKRAVLLGMSNPATLDSIKLTVKIKDAKGDVKSAVLEALLQENTPETAEGGWDKDRSDSVWTIPSPTTATQRTDSIASLFAPTMTSLSSRPTAAEMETAAISPITAHEWLLKHDFTIDSENHIVEVHPDASFPSIPEGKPHEAARRQSTAKVTREAALVAIFHEAATRGDNKVISLLLGDPNDPCNKPLVPSVNVRSPQTKQTALHRAAMKNNISTALLLVQHAADVNDLGPEHGSPLHFAAARGHSAMVRLLLEVGADIDAQTKEWPYSPLRVAVSAGREDAVQDLISRGANLEVRDNEGWTPLSAAAKRGRENIVKLLLEAGADAKSQDKDRWTPLHSAAYGGYEKIAKMLIDKGADVNVTHVAGDLMSKKTAWDIARNRKHYYMRPLLQPHSHGFLETIENVLHRRRKHSKSSTLST